MGLIQSIFFWHGRGGGGGGEGWVLGNEGEMGEGSKNKSSPVPKVHDYFLRSVGVTYMAKTLPSR